MAPAFLPLSVVGLSGSLQCLAINKAIVLQHGSGEQKDDDSSFLLRLLDGCLEPEHSFFEPQHAPFPVLVQLPGVT